MVKSVFTKYVTAFMLITLIGFTLVAAVVGTMVSEYSLRQKDTMVQSTAVHLQQFLMQDSTAQPSLGASLESPPPPLAGLCDVMVACNEDLSLLIVDENGVIHFHSQSDSEWKIDLSKKIPQNHLSTLSQNTPVKYMGTLDGILPEKCLIYAVPLTEETGEFVGAVFSCTVSAPLGNFVSSIIKTIILTSFWVMLAAMLAVYFISERIIGPLKHMSIAAKNFGTGHYDVRVPVNGKDEVSELALAFNNMAEAIASNEEQRRVFLANVSHDLRTPMTTISGFIDGILDGAIPPEKHEYYLNIIATEVRRLSRLVATLLDISRIQAGDRKFQKADFNICEMARQILISFEQKIEAKHLEVEFDCAKDDMYANADRDAIYQILYNICDNAVKFSKDGGAYRIRIFAKDKKIFVSVYNEGIGIPESELPHIFDRFYKSDKSRGLDKSGVGLGLYIAKTILDAHNEEIWVQSRYNEYCEFIFTLTPGDEPDHRDNEFRPLLPQTTEQQ